QDDPATRWDELKLFGRLGLSPFNAHLTTCREVNTLPSGMRCIRQEYDDAWEGFADARASYITTETNGVSAVQAAESKVLTAQNRLEDAERALEIAQSGRPQASAASIQSELDAANAALEALLDFSDEAEVAQAKANLEVALATLDDLHHDDHDIALAQQQMEDAQLAVEKLEAGRDPLDEERREARIIAAETRVTVAETARESAQLALADTELRAPFSGVIVAPNVDAGEEVAPRQFLMSLADASEWELVTVDLDELSVIHLSEGDSVRINFDALPALEMNGTVMRISRFGEEVQGAVTYSSDIRISGSDPRLRWGMTASISK
ncbi:MAG: HlyD family efflux transporter periplasmic adaptor subunit, partial [Chloroflexi bacterium]|nr:HlyD family efflux transporter periplasmic adaptor subunit [Chloroflexota bacterium]